MNINRISRSAVTIDPRYLKRDVKAIEPPPTSNSVALRNNEKRVVGRVPELHRPSEHDRSRPFKG